MKNISGTRTIPHGRKAVFHEGLNAHHWEYSSGGFCITPRDSRIEKDGLIGISIRKVLTVSFEAVVAECIKDEHVRVEGSAAGFGDIGLAINLHEGKKGDTTHASFDLSVDLHRVPRLGRMVIDSQLRGYLNGEMDPFIDQLALSITGAVDNPIARDLKLAS